MIATHVNGFYKYYFRLLEKISASLACRTGVKIWLTPPKYKPKLPERLTIRNAAIKRIPFRESVYQSTHDTFYTLYSWGKGPIVLLVHGWGSSAARMTSLVKPLANAGYQVVDLDTLGHGDAPGKQTDFIEMIDVIKDLDAKCFGFHAIIAHSTGALATVMAIHAGVRTEKLVVCATAASIDYYLRKFSEKLGASRQMMGRISHAINTVLKRNIKDFSIINVVPKLNKPALIVHDKRDEIIAHAEAVALAKLWPKSELHLTDSLGHFGVLLDAKTVSKIIDYIYLPQNRPVVRDKTGVEKAKVRK